METIYNITDSLSLLKGELKETNYLYVDVETIGLYGEIRLLQCYQSSWEKVLIFDFSKMSFESMQELKEILQRSHLVFHNGCYDLACLKLDVDNLQWEDTFLAGRLHYPHLETFSLDSMLKEALGFCPYLHNGLTKKAMQKSSFSKELTAEQLLYSAIDVYYMPALAGEVCTHFEDISYTLDKLSVQYMLKFSEVGLPVNRKTLADTKIAITESVSEFKAKYPHLNPNSPKQVKDALGTESSDDKTLAELTSQGITLASDVRAWRKELKKLNFCEKFDLDRLKGHFNIATRSGRSNCSDENLQQIPSSLKHLFETEKYFVYADFSNLELRTFCAMVGERVMERMFRDDVDLHSYSAHRLFNTPLSEVTKQQRQIAKTFNFSSLYGAGVAKRLQILLANTGIALPIDEGERLAREWLNAYPSVKDWQAQNAKKWRAGIKGSTALGRPYIAKLYTDFGNVQIQGSGAEVAKLALHYMFKDLDTNKLCAFIHDSYTFECETMEEALLYAEKLANAMQKAWFEVSKNFVIKDLPMPVLAGIGKNWKKLQGDEDLLGSYELKGYENSIPLSND